MAVPNLVQIRPWRLLGEWVKYNDFLFIYTFLSGDRLQVRPVNGFLRLMAQTTRTRAKGVPFGGFVDTAPHFGSEIPKIPILGA